MKFKRYSEFPPCREVIVKLTGKKTFPKTAWKLLIPGYGLLTLKNTTAQIVEASVTVNNVSPIQDQDCFSRSKNWVKWAIARTVLLLRHDAYCTIITISFLSCNAEIKAIDSQSIWEHQCYSNDSNNHRADAHISSLGRKPLNRLSCAGLDDEKAMEHGHTRAR